MSKTKNDAPTVIEAGKAITITADSREEAVKKINALHKQAQDSGLKYQSGGFIGYCDGVFSTMITFTEL